MIILTKLNGDEFVLNEDHIEAVYENPDTTIHLTNGKIYIVKETMEKVKELSQKYKKEIYNINFQSNN